MKEIRSNKGIIDAAIIGRRASSRESPAIICVVGRSGSGKSTFIRKKIKDEFVRLDAGLLFFEVGGEHVAEFPGSFVDDLDEVGSVIARESLRQKIDLVVEFSGADTVRMQMLMRALTDIEYSVEIKYINVDLPQASIWNTERDDLTIPAQDTDDFHFKWLVAGINSLHIDKELHSEQGIGSSNRKSSKSRFSSLFSGIRGLNKNPQSPEEAKLIAGQFIEFSSSDESVIRNESRLPVKKYAVLRAFELLLAQGRERGDDSPNLEEITKWESEYRRAFEYQEIESHDLKLIEELGDQLSGRDIAIRLTKDDVTAAEEEEYDLIRLNRKRLVEKYQKRAESDYQDHTRKLKEDESSIDSDD